MAKQSFTSGQVLTAAQMTTLQANDYNQTVSTKTGNYTLVAGDAGTRVVGNGTSLTFTVNDSVFTAGDTLTFDNRDSTVLTIAAGAGVTINAAAGLTLAQYQTAQLYALSASSFVLSKSDVTASAGALTLISSTTIGSAVSSVTVSSAFSSTYDNYRIIISGGASSASTGLLTMQLGSTATGYYYGGAGARWAAGTVDAVAGNNAASFAYVGTGRPDGLGADISLVAPNLAKYTYAAYWYDSGDSSVTVHGFLANTTQYTAFTIATVSGTLTGGTIKVYGYANS